MLPARVALFCPDATRAGSAVLRIAYTKNHLKSTYKVKITNHDNMKNIRLAIIALLFLCENSFAQCESWGTPGDSLRTVVQHTLYRDYIKNAKGKSPEETAELYREALPFWTYCYKNAPGGTKKHFRDGIKIYKAFLAVETDETKKKAYLDMIYNLYDRGVQCFEEESYTRTRQLVNMFYYLGTGQEEINELAKKIIDVAGNETESVVLLPLMSSSVYLFQQEKINQSELLEVRQQIKSIVDHHLSTQKDEKIKTQYSDAAAQVEAQFASVKTGFDCSYYRPAIVAKYKADPNNIDVCVAVRQELIDKYCGENDPLVQEITAKIKASNQEIRTAKAEKDRIITEKLNSPARKAGEAYKVKNYSEAIRLFELAIAESSDANKQANYHYFIAASYLNTDKNQQARTHARKAAALRENWGKPLIVIGKAYMGGACGSNDWGKPLCYMAAIDKFRRAKSIDPSVAGEADDLIRKYDSNYPLIEAAHSRTKKDGERVNTGCWINETVILKTK